MDMQERTYQAAAREAMSSVAGSALFAAALMLLFGLWLWGLSASADAAPAYQVAVSAFPWVLLLGGIAMLISAALCWTGWRGALAVDAVFSGLVGSALLIDGLVQIGYELTPEYGFDINSGLMVIFGVMFVFSAKRSWGLHRRFVIGASGPMADDTGPAVSAPPTRPSAEPTTVERLLDERKAEPSKVEKVEPAEQATPSPVDQPPEAVPHDEREGGFLAELGREDDHDRE